MFPSEISVDHRHGAVQQIAQIVGQIEVDPLDETFRRERAVGAERHFPQQEITERIEPVAVDQTTGSTTLPLDLDILPSFMSSQPCPNTFFGSGKPRPSA